MKKSHSSKSLVIIHHYFDHSFVFIHFILIISLYLFPSFPSSVIRQIVLQHLNLLVQSPLSFLTSRMGYSKTDAI